MQAKPILIYVRRYLNSYVKVNCTVAFFFFFFFFFFSRWIPESPRWLVANNRLDEAHSLLMTYAAKNGVTVDAKHLKHVISEVKKAGVRKDDTRKYGTFDLFKTPKLRKRIMICCFNW